MTSNVAHSRYGRALVAVRDADVAAEAVGIFKPRLLVTVFIFSGATAAFAGGLFARLQTYITPDAFTFDLSVLFFIAILIGGRGSILGPLHRHHRPDAAAGICRAARGLVDLPLCRAAAGRRARRAGRHRGAARLREPQAACRPVAPSFRARTAAPLLAGRRTEPAELALDGLVLSFGGVRAVDGVDLDGEVRADPRPDRPERQRQDDDAQHHLRLLPRRMPARSHPGRPSLAAGRTRKRRCRLGIARTFQTPRIVGEATVLENVMMGGDHRRRNRVSPPRCSACPPAARTKRRSRARPCGAAAPSACDGLADVRADRLQHSELRFHGDRPRADGASRPSCCSTSRPPGLSADEIERLGELVTAISRRGVGVLLVEHHADLIFDICEHVTVLNLGRVLAAGTPAEIRVHKEVVSAYLGG